MTELTTVKEQVGNDEIVVHIPMTPFSAMLALERYTRKAEEKRRLKKNKKS